MKYNIQNITMLTAALFFVACSSDEGLTPQQPVTPEAGEEMGFKAIIGDQLEDFGEEYLDNPSTRATISPDGVGFFGTWLTSDNISVSDGTLMYTYQPTSNAATSEFVAKTGKNSFTTNGGGSESTFYAFYPADAVLGWNGSTVSTMIYTEQKYSENVEGGIMGPYMAAVATTTGGGANASFTFGHVCSVIDVNLSSFNGGTVESVALCSNTGVSLTGRISYDADTKKATVSTKEEGTYFSTLQSDVVVVSDINQDTPVVRFYVLPVKQTSGFTITVRTTDGNYYTKKSSGEVGKSDPDVNYLASVDGTTGAVCKPYYKKYNFGTTANAKTNRWMAMIPGSTYFSMLSTPGSHDSATSSVTSYTSSSKCQSETIAQQLENGVRAFDLRPTYMYTETITKDNLYIFHGQVNTNVLYKDAIKDMVEFLKANPTETISVIMVKENGKPTITLQTWTDYTNEMCAAIDEIHTQYTDNIKLLDHSYYTLNDYRGKIFFGYRNAWDLHKTVRVTNWADNASVKDYSVGVGSTCTASIEDEYNKNGDNKKTVVNALLDMASANTNHTRFHYTFTSCANSPSSYASVQNPAAATHIGTLTGPTGYVYGDFMGSSSYSGSTLLKAIVAQNLKYVYKNRSRCSTTAPSGTDTGVDIAADEFANDGTVYVKGM